MTSPISDPKVALLRDLVEIPSGTSNIEGVNRVQKRIADELRSMGGAISLHDNDQGASASGQFLIGEFKGAETELRSVTRFNEPRVVNLVSHADTVFELESGFLHFHFDPATGLASGPGVIDDKGGIVVALEGLRRWLDRTPVSERKIGVRFLCAPNEETGSTGFHHMLARLGKDSWIALGFEPAMEDGSVVRSRVGNRWYKIRVEGQAAHSGRHLERGVNAAHELAFKLVELQRLNDPKEEVTLSTSSLGGGSGKYNIVCADAEAKIDVRFTSFDGRDRAHRAIETIVSKSHIPPSITGRQPRSSYEVADDCPPFSETDESVRLMEIYIELVEKLENRKISSSKCGGAADVNYMSRPGLHIIDGLGAYGGGMHRDDEHIQVSSLETRSEALALFLARLNQGV